MTAYDDFLASKRRSVHDIGPSADASDVHPLLHDWQAEIVTWAVRKGRAAVFAGGKSERERRAMRSAIAAYTAHRRRTDGAA